MIMTVNVGPTHCDICGEWPARQTERGKRCHMCETREWCNEHPVPLPSNLKTVKELAGLGYEPAIRHLLQNNSIQATPARKAKELTESAPAGAPGAERYLSGGNMVNCECKNWARGNIVLLTEHHPKCPKYDVEAEAKAHIEALLRGIIIWASDEDGVHYQCFDAFRSAAFFIGKPGLVKAETDNNTVM